MALEEKIAFLRKIIHEYNRVAVAFSGGVDSALLLKCALDSLGAGNVLILHAASVLQKPGEQQAALGWLERHGYGKGMQQVVVDLQPLEWKEFVRNSADRCYLCKLRMYKRFLEEAERYAIHCLLDGTNTDDLKHNRPGLRAIHQLGVKTPLLAAGFSKSEIRQASRGFELDTGDAPAASCLATRIPQDMTITLPRLQRIGRLEVILEKMGFSGCRVRLGEDELSVCISLQSGSLDALGQENMRCAILRSFQNEGIGRVLVDLAGR